MLRSTYAGHVNMLLRVLATSFIDGFSPNLYKIFILKIFLLRFKMSDIGFLIIWDESFVLLWKLWMIRIIVCEHFSNCILVFWWIKTKFVAVVDFWLDQKHKHFREHLNGYFHEVEIHFLNRFWIISIFQMFADARLQMMTIPHVV